jgi:hypothetical protein
MSFSVRALCVCVVSERRNQSCREKKVTNINTAAAAAAAVQKERRKIKNFCSLRSCASFWERFCSARYVQSYKLKQFNREIRRSGQFEVRGDPIIDPSMMMMMMVFLMVLCQLELGISTQ